MERVIPAPHPCPLCEQFRLDNEPARPAPRKIEGQEKTKQRKLFAGLDCLPGQLDLFETDGDGGRDQ